MLSDNFFEKEDTLLNLIAYLRFYLHKTQRILYLRALTNMNVKRTLYLRLSRPTFCTE